MRWESVKLGDTATFVNGYPFKPTDWSTKGKEIIRIQNLTKSNGIEANLYEGTIQERYLVKKGDLLISWSGTLGIYEWDGDDAWLNQHIFKVVFDKAEVNKKYFKFLIQSKLHELEQQVHGATMKHITKGKFDNINVPLPPLHIQEQIAETLDKADALRRNDQELLSKYDELAQSIFCEMFGDPVNNEKGWDVKKLEELIFPNEKINYGIVQPGDEDPTGIPVIRVGDFHDMGIKSENVKRVSKNIETQYKKTRLVGDEILIGCVGSIGKIALVDSTLAGYNIVRATARIRPNPLQVNRFFLASLLSTPKIQDYFIKETRTVSQPTLNISHIASTQIALPPMKTQEKFSSIYTNLQKQKRIIAKQSQSGLFETLLNNSFKMS